MICVRSYLMRGEGGIGISATDIPAIQREIELRKTRIRMDTAPNGENQRALANNASARSKGKSQPARRKLPFLVNVKLRSLARHPTPCQVNVASLGLTREKISAGRAMGDAYLLVMLFQTTKNDHGRILLNEYKCWCEREASTGR
mmetsp:Transcript_9851/g.23811  ORF Transcript_9851/g.23811 Transcript_9851/m.23811 type:complete len:145 (-) Transcript_9851:123-557(-)